MHDPLDLHLSYTFIVSALEQLHHGGPILRLPTGRCDAESTMIGSCRLLLLMAGARENDQETTPPRVARGWRWEQPRWPRRWVLCRSMWLRPSRWYRSRVRGGCGRMVVQLRYCLCAMKFRDRSILLRIASSQTLCWPTRLQNRLVALLTSRFRTLHLTPCGTSSCGTSSFGTSFGGFAFEGPTSRPGSAPQSQRHRRRLRLCRWPDTSAAANAFRRMG